MRFLNSYEIWCGFEFNFCLHESLAMKHFWRISSVILRPLNFFPIIYDDINCPFQGERRVQLTFSIIFIVKKNWCPNCPPVFIHSLCRQSYGLPMRERRWNKKKGEFNQFFPHRSVFWGNCNTLSDRVAAKYKYDAFSPECNWPDWPHH